jgi:hypothetical protein
MRVWIRVALTVVCVGVENDDGVGQHVRGVNGPELAAVVFAVALRELLHQAVDLLRLAREAEAR